MDRNYNFTGGFWRETQFGTLSATRPFGVLEVCNDSLILHDRLSRKEIKLSKGEVDRIEIQKVSILMGYGIQISYNSGKKRSQLYFWYSSFHFEKLINALNECGWSVEPDDGKMSFSKILGRLTDIIFPLVILMWIFAAINIMVGITISSG